MGETAAQDFPLHYCVGLKNFSDLGSCVVSLLYLILLSENRMNIEIEILLATEVQTVFERIANV